MEDTDVLRFRQIAALIKGNPELVADLVARVKALADSGNKRNPYGDAYLGIMEFVCCFQANPGIVATAYRKPGTAISHQFKSFGVFAGVPRGEDTWGPPYIAWLFSKDELSAKDFLKKVKAYNPNNVVPGFKRVASQFSFDHPKDVVDAIRLGGLSNRTRRPRLFQILESNWLPGPLFGARAQQFRKLKSFRDRALKDHVASKLALNSWQREEDEFKKIEKLKALLDAAVIRSLKLYFGYRELIYLIDEDLRRDIAVSLDDFAHLLENSPVRQRSLAENVETGVSFQAALDQVLEQQLIRLHSAGARP